MRTACYGSITTDGGLLRLPAAGDRDRGTDRIEQFGSGDEHHAGAGSGQDPAARSGIFAKIILAALDRPQGDGIDHQPRLEARLDPEKATYLPEHGQSLRFERPDRGFEPFKS